MCGLAPLIRSGRPARARPARATGRFSSLGAVMSRTDRLIGIALGIVIGIAALILFVFLGSGSSIDAPAIDHGGVERTSTGGGPP